MKIEIESTEISSNGGHGVFITGNADVVFTDFIASDNEVDGIHIDSASSVKILGGKINSNGRSGVYLRSCLTNLHDAGLSPDAPNEVVKEASEMLSEIHQSSIEEKIGRLKKLQIMKYLGTSADLATIIALIIQVGSSL